MKRYSVYLAVLMFLAGGCKFLSKFQPASASLNSASLQSLVSQAVSGDTGANARLSGLVDLNIPINKDYNKLIVDSITTKDRKKFFVVILNYSELIYNRLAVYDSVLNIYLLDKSLNGYISESALALNDKRFIKVSENFISKDVLQLNRMSLYEINDTSANLCLRTFTKLVVPGAVFSQDVSEFSTDRINTDLSGPNTSSISEMKDVFAFSPSRRQYISHDKVFDNFVLGRIKMFVHNSDKPEITDRKSLYASVGIDLDVDTIKNTGNAKNTEGYNLTLPENWKTLNGIAFTELLKKQLRGTKYMNETIGASISIIALPGSDSSESYISCKLSNSTSGKYRVRFSEKIVSKNNYVQFFEYSCGKKKFLLILSALKNNYDKHIAELKDIINSFSINC